LCYFIGKQDLLLEELLWGEEETRVLMARKMLVADDTLALHLSSTFSYGFE
jgi:hypothetical protein